LLMSPRPFFGWSLSFPLSPLFHRCSLFVVVAAGSSLSSPLPPLHCHLLPPPSLSLPHCSPFPPHEQWLVAVVQGAGVAVAAVVVVWLYTDQT
jgi:hypothetical protein